MNTTVSIRLDKAVKDSAQAVASSAGLTLSALINSYLRQVAASRRIEIYAPEPMTPHLEKLIAEVETEIATGQVSGPFDDVEDFLADLKK